MPPIANGRPGGMSLMPQPNHEDINATWEYLKNGVNSIMVNLDGGMTMETVSLPRWRSAKLHRLARPSIIFSG